MLLSVWFLREMWNIYYCDLTIVGKIILFPLFLLGVVGIAIYGLAELVLINPWIFLFALCSRTTNVKDVLHDFWD